MADKTDKTNKTEAKKDENKLKALEAALAQIEKQYGKGSVMKLGDNNTHMNIETVPTGCLSLDIALGLGGYLDIGILDTMKDLFVNFIGAVVFSFIGYFYVKSRGKGKFASRFIPQVVDIQPEVLDPRTPEFFKKEKKSGKREE